MNLHLNSANRTLGETVSTFEIIMETALLTPEVEEIFIINIMKFNTFNNFYQVQSGYHTEFKILIYISNSELHDIIIGELPEGKLNINDVLTYLKTLSNNLVTVKYNIIKINLYLKQLLQIKSLFIHCKL